MSRARLSLLAVTATFVLACASKEPTPPPAPPAPIVAPPPAPTPEPVVSAAPPPPPASSTFPALTPAERAERTARAEALLEGGSIPPNDGPRNPRTISISLVGEAGATGGVSGEGVDTCRHRLLPAPPAELKGKLTVDAAGVVTAAKIAGPANAKAFVACAEATLVGRKVKGPAGDHDIVIAFQNAAASKLGLVVQAHRLEDRADALLEDFYKLLVHEPIVVRDLEHVDDLRADVVAERLAQAIEVLLLHDEDHVGPRDVAEGDDPAGALVGSGAAHVQAVDVAEDAFGGGAAPLVFGAEEEDVHRGRGSSRRW